VIADNQTNTLYISDLLPKRHPRLTADLHRICRTNDIPLRHIRGTRDIWCRDYMPVQVDDRRFVQFRYQPDYLWGRWARTITPPEVCRALPCIGQCIQSNIVLDGGNVVKWSDKVIVTDKIFRENPGSDRQALLEELASLLEVERVIIIPVEPGDVLGHADGVVRFVDGQHVLVNDYSKMLCAYGRQLRAVLRSAGLECITVPYAPDLAWRPRAKYDIPPATGAYLNFVQTARVLSVPVYALGLDDQAVNMIAASFPAASVFPMNVCTLAKQGGAINCATWGLQQQSVNSDSI
jgi:agmatine deiminase